MGRSWGYPLLGAAELALKLPKMGDQGSWEITPHQLAEAGASDLSVNKC